MCGIAGFFNPYRDYTADRAHWLHVLENMNRAQKRRGPDDEGTYLSPLCGLAHVRLEIIDLSTGQQPIVKQKGDRECAIVFNGEIYNMKELKAELMSEGALFQTASDTEVILEGYMRHGKDYIQKLNGIFAIALWDSASLELLLFRALLYNDR